MHKGRNDAACAPSSSRTERCNHNPRFDHERYETVCTKCGLVLSSFDSLEEQDVGPYIQRSKQHFISVAWNKGINTKIGSITHDSSGRKLSPQLVQRMLNLKRLDERISKELLDTRKHARFLAELNRLADKLNIGYLIRKEAVLIYSKIDNKKMIRGTPIVVVAPAILYVACRLHGSPTMLYEILKESLVSTEVAKKRVLRFYRRLLTELGLQHCRPDNIAPILKIARILKISNKTRDLAIKILNETKRKHFSMGKNPLTIVAAALYVACLLSNEKKTQKQLARELGITDAAIRSCFKILKKELKLEYPLRLAREQAKNQKLRQVRTTTLPPS